MSKNIHISRLSTYIQNKIILALQSNGCDEDAINEIISSAKVSDVEEYIDMDEVFA